MSSAQNAKLPNHKLSLKVMVTQQKLTDTKDNLQVVLFVFVLLHKTKGQRAPVALEIT